MFYLLNVFLQMKILQNNTILKETLKKIDNLGFVPTMGSIHDGHISLIKNSKKVCKKTIVSIFVNPKQFNSKKDFSSYPKNIKKDLSILRKNKVDYLYLPNVKDIYNYKRQKKIKLIKKDLILCAKYRKGHFEGVLDVMDRLTSLINPYKIFMGEKDFQQLYLVRKFLKNKYKNKTKTIICKTIRNLDKVSLSSRNMLLTSRDLLLAGQIVKNLISFKRSLKNQSKIRYHLNLKKKELSRIYNIKIDYLDLRKTSDLTNSANIDGSKIFIAYYLKDIRLIDNL